MTDSERIVEFTSEAGDGLLGVVSRAEQAIAAAGEGPLGVLDIELDAPGPLRLGVEAAYAEREGRGGVERLDIHVAIELDAPPSDDLVRAALSELGGTAYTNICLAPVSGEELVDATLHFGSSVPYWATCEAIVAEHLSADEASAIEEVLATLGIGCRRRGDSLALSRHALRKRLDAEAQLRATRAAIARRLRVELYAATLPLTRSVRISLRPLSPEDTSRGFELALVASRRIEGEVSAARDAVALKDFVARHFDFDFGDESWRVANAHGDRPEHRPHGPIGSRRPLEWSLNWGARRR